MLIAHAQVDGASAQRRRAASTGLSFIGEPQKPSRWAIVSHTTVSVHWIADRLTATQPAPSQKDHKMPLISIHRY